MAFEENSSPQPGSGAKSDPDSQIIRRPFSVTLLIILGLSIVGFNLVRLTQTLSQWTFLNALRSYLPAYLALTAIAWGSIGLTIVWGLWTGKHWAPNVVRIGYVIFLIYYWLDTLLVTNPAGRGSNQALIICLQIISLVFVFGIFASPATKKYYRRNQ
jgi:hypothetical protein